MIIKRAVLALILFCLIVSFATPAKPAKADIDITDIYLMGPGGTGGSISVPLVSTGVLALGVASSLNYWHAQSFTVPAGLLSTISIEFGNNNGSPTGTVTWEIHSDNVSIPGTLLASGTFTPAPNTKNTINTSDSSLFLYGSTTYWMLFKSTATQTNNNYWTLKYNSTDAYSDGQRAQTVDAGVSYGVFSQNDLQITASTTLGSEESSFLNDKLAQSFTVGGYVTATAVKLDLIKFGSPTGQITLNIESDVGNSPSGYLIADGATGTYNEADLTTDYALTTIDLDSPINLQPGIKYWIVITTDREDSTDYVALGSTSDCAEDQYLKVHNQGVWKSEDTTGIFEFSLSDSPEQPVSTNSANISTLGALIILIVIGFGQVYLLLRVAR